MSTNYPSTFPNWELLALKFRVVINLEHQQQPCSFRLTSTRTNIYEAISRAADHGARCALTDSRKGFQSSDVSRDYVYDLQKLL